MSDFTVAIVGRPNVGKSTFFNRLTKQHALTAAYPGVTRDRRYGIASCQGNQFLLIDTGGVGEMLDTTSESIQTLVEAQTRQAIEEADLLLWLLDGRVGITLIDQQLADKFRKLGKPIYLLVNKLEGMNRDVQLADFHQLGFHRLFAISAKHGDGVNGVLAELSAEDKFAPTEIDSAPTDTLALCVFGRPNVGKSTLVNALLGYPRMLTSEEPGTTRDSIAIRLTKKNKSYTVVDTAGINRRKSIHGEVEKLSVSQSIHTVWRSDIVIFLVDAETGIIGQDLTLLGLVADSGKALIIAVNKWDCLSAEQKLRLRNSLKMKCTFLDYAKVHFISALHSVGVGALLRSVDRVKRCWDKKYPSSQLTNMLHEFITVNSPPVVRGRRIKLRYAHLGDHNPFKIIIHGNRTDFVPSHYTRYLSRAFRTAMMLFSIPVLIEFKQGKNPYQPRR